MSSHRFTVFALIIAILAACVVASDAQTEVLTNATVIEMSQAGLDKRVILNKIASTAGDYDISAKALIELKKAGVNDDVIAGILEKGRATPKTTGDPAAQPVKAPAATASVAMDPKESFRSAKTIAFLKSSAQPSRQNLEKALLKRADFKKLDLTILRYKEEADLFVEIGFVSGSWITHRYVYRIYDRRTGAVLAAGETTSWGSLADNLARHISRSLSQLSEG